MKSKIKKKRYYYYYNYLNSQFFIYKFFFIYTWINDTYFLFFFWKQNWKRILFKKKYNWNQNNKQSLRHCCKLRFQKEKSTQRKYEKFFSKWLMQLMKKSELLQTYIKRINNNKKNRDRKNWLESPSLSVQLN